MKKYLLIICAIIFCTNNAFSQCACCAGAGSALNSDNASGVFTLKKKQFSIEAIGDYRTIKIEDEGGGHDAGGDSTAEEETPLKSIFLASVGLKYGLTNRITLSAILPYALLNTGKGSDNGLGDLILMGTYNLIKQNSFNLALTGGIELPTGVEKGSAFDESTVVVGSGSYDPILSIAASKRWNRLTGIGSAFHRQTTKGFGNTTYSSVSLQNLLLSYTIKGHSNSCDADSVCLKHNVSWNVSAGYYGEWLGQIKEVEEGGEEVKDPNTGYYIGFATIGTNVSLKSWSFPLTFSYPLFQKMNGDQNIASYRVRLGIVKNF